MTVRRLPCLLACATLFLVMAEPLAASDFEAVARLNTEISTATWTGDAVWFEENVADDYLLVTPSGAIYTKRDIIREVSTPSLRMEPYEPSEVQIRIHGETAIVVGRVLQRFTLGRIRYANDLRYTNVYGKRKGRWYIVAAHTSNVSVGQ